jgi:hypothetical protein
VVEVAAAAAPGAAPPAAAADAPASAAPAGAGAGWGRFSFTSRHTAIFFRISSFSSRALRFFETSVPSSTTFRANEAGERGALAAGGASAVVSSVFENAEAEAEEEEEAEEAEKLLAVEDICR